MVLLSVVAVVLLVAVSAFFSSSEIAVFSLEDHRMDSLAGRPGGESLARLREDPHRLLVTLLVGNNFVNVAIASLVTALVVDRLAGSAGVAAATLLASTVVLLFGEIVPKSYGVANPERVALAVARPITVLQTLLYPVVAAFETVTDGINRLTGGGSDIERPYVTREEVAAIVEHAAALGVLEGEEGAMIDRVFRLNTTAVGDVMVPRDRVRAVDVSASVAAAVAACGAGQVTRLPLQEGDLDRVVGYVDVRDLVSADADASLESLARPALHVVARREVDEVLAELRASRTELAVVHDAAGRVAGVATVEDLVEQLVGELFDLGSGPVTVLSPATATVRGSATPTEVNRALDAHLPAGADSVAALLADELDRPPKPGDAVDLADAHLTVRAVEDGRIRRVHVERRDAGDANDPSGRDGRDHSP